MPTAYLCNSTANAILSQYLTSADLWLALHTGEPGPLYDPSTEVAGRGYARQPITFAAPSARGVVSNSDQAFSAMPACTVTWLSVITASVSGVPVFTMQVSGGGIVVPQNQQFLVAAGDVGFQFV